MRKVNLFIVLVLALVLIVAGCSSPSSPKEGAGGSTVGSGKVEESREPKTLTIMVAPFPNDVEKKLWEKIVKAFEDKNQGIKVELKTGDVAVESGKLTTMLNSGVTPPDAILIYAGPARVSVLSQGNLIMPLEELYTKNNWKEKLTPFAYSMATLSGKIYEVPHGLDAIGVFYNKDLFAKAGVKVPATKDELVTAMQKLKDAGIQPIALGTRGGNGGGWLYGNILDAVAGRKKVEEVLYGKGKWNDPEMVKATETLNDWVNKGFIVKEAVSLTFPDAKAQFLDKKAAMYASGTPTITDIASMKLEDSIGHMTFPSFIEGQKTNPTGGLGYSWVVPKNTKNVDLVEKWINFILTDFTEIAYKDPSFYLIPATKTAFTLKPAGSILAEAVKNISDGSAYNPAYNPTVFIGNSTKEAYLQNLQGVIGGLISPQEAMNNIEAGNKKDRAEGFKLK
ncbi:raffinose/stachyose/melibiose transport system substrate-binding protein [Paenibacillus sp. yr247]|uniref:ABC transporter substrate-binding protein n=1 Tax=Paenibacillus sp. yr247 TaxID=1761880 RepID=UPI0008897E73|nr:extracellular solute-binding protein [Paenibacillus sp. yr247]SDO32952.1 raffinose/stachyose/melibiose transport system substrate-binding protein [Paenibacillus sp. yr247]